MPGTPINKNNNNGGEKVDDGLQNGQNQSELRGSNQQQEREITQTDKLNKRLLESVLERMSKTDDFNKFLDSEETVETEDADQAEF